MTQIKLKTDKNNFFREHRDKSIVTNKHKNTLKKWSREGSEIGLAIGVLTCKGEKPL